MTQDERDRHMLKVRFGGKADITSSAECCLLTQSGHD